MAWNHRIIRHVTNAGTAAWYGLHEVYYDDKGNITDWTNDPVDVSASSPKELKALITTMLHDCDRPFIHAKTLREKLRGGGKTMAAKKKAK